MNPRSVFAPALGATILAVMAVCSTGCGRFSNQRAAIEKAIRDHLGSRTDLAMNQMVMRLGEVKVDGNAAGAEVVFSTNSDPPARMSYHYELRKEAGAWQVTGGWPSGSSAGAQHPTMGAGEPGSAGEGSVPESGGAPAGSMPALPPGHPPISGMPPSAPSPQQ